MSILVTVYIPTRNRLNLLKRAVDSVLNQTFQSFELIIVDDFSEDNTSDYLKGLSHPRVKYFTNSSPMGACYSRNLAIKNALGKYVTGLDDDDYFYNDRLESFINNYSSMYSFLYSKNLSIMDYIFSPRFIFTKELPLNHLLSSNYVGNQIFIEKKRILDVGGYDETLPANQDYDLWIRLLLSYGRAKNLNINLMYIDNSHDELRISSSIKKKIQSFEIMLEKYRDVFTSRQLKILKCRKIVREESTTIFQVLRMIDLYTLRTIVIFFKRYFN